MKTLILDNFDSFTYNIFQYCAELGGNPVVYRNNAISIKEIETGKFSHIMISPGPGTPENKKDFGICTEVIQQFSGKIPILGICLGHQGIIHALGGKIMGAPIPMHGKKSVITIHNRRRIFKGLEEKIDVMRYHSLIGERKSLPKSLEITAETEDGIVMAISHKNKNLFGVQFHPESAGTTEGKKIIKNFLAIQQEVDTEKFIENIAKNKISEEEIADTLKTMAVRGESVQEITGMVRELRKHAVPMEKIPGLMDTCGTGGSGLSRVNISTVAAFVLAACGIKISKHGNRAMSGRCGSFDVLEFLGIKIELSAEKIREGIEKFNIGFLFAPLFHPVMKKVIGIRKRIGIKTIFNLVGPLVNPMNPDFHLLGTSSEESAKKLIQVMKNIGYKKAMVVTGKDSLDDITMTDKTIIYELKNRKIRRFEWEPEEIGIQKVQPKKIEGGSIEKNAEIFQKLLENTAPQALKNLLLINVGFGLIVAGKINSIQEGIELAEKIILSKKPLKLFKSYKKFSHV